jgi:protein-disulfide isomerase
MKRRVVLICATVFFCQRGLAASPVEELAESVDALKQGQTEMQREIRDILSALKEQQGRAAPKTRRAPPPPRRSSIDVGGEHFVGKEDAVVTFVEFTDYQCPLCRRHAREVVPEILRNYVDTGKLKYVIHDFPLESHKQAFKAGEAVNCAADQGKFWEMHQALLTRAGSSGLSTDDLLRQTAALAMDSKQLADCLTGGKYAEKVRKDVAEGAAVGVRRTPTFLIGLTDPDSSRVTGRLLEGTTHFPYFKMHIERTLREAGD